MRAYAPSLTLLNKPFKNVAELQDLIDGLYKARLPK